jgi:hypothetical protein
MQVAGLAAEESPAPEAFPSRRRVCFRLITGGVWRWRPRRPPTTPSAAARRGRDAIGLLSSFPASYGPGGGSFGLGARNRVAIVAFERRGKRVGARRRRWLSIVTGAATPPIVLPPEPEGNLPDCELPLAPRARAQRIQSGARRDILRKPQARRYRYSRCRALGPGGAIQDGTGPETPGTDDEAGDDQDDRTSSMIASESSALTSPPPRGQRC